MPKIERGCVVDILKGFGRRAMLAGVGFGLATLYGVLFDSLRIVSPGFCDDTVSLFSAVQVVLFVAAAGFARRFAALAKSRVFIAFACVGALAALVSCVPSFAAVLPAFASVALVACAAACQCYYLLAFFTVLARANMVEVIVALAVGHVLSAAFASVVVMLDVRVVSAAFTALLPVAAAFVWKLVRGSRRAVFDAPEAGELRESELRNSVMKMPLRPVILLVAVVFASSAVKSYSGSGGIVFVFLGALFAALFAAVILRIGKHTANLRALYDAALLFLAVSMFLASANCLGVGGAAAFAGADFLSNAGYTMFSIFFMALLCSACRRNGLNALFVFGAVEALECIAFEAGRLACGMAQLMSGPNVALLLFGGAIVLAVAFTALLTDSDYRTAWGTVSDASAPPIAEFYYSLPDVCSAIAQQYGLTRREEEVLVLLAQRKTIPEIEGELYVSNSTVKSHCKNIYKKLGVHKRQELLAMVGHPSIGE